MASRTGLTHTLSAALRALASYPIESMRKRLCIDFEAVHEPDPADLL